MLLSSICQNSKFVITSSAPPSPLPSRTFFRGTFLRASILCSTEPIWWRSSPAQETSSVKPLTNNRKTYLRTTSLHRQTPAATACMVPWPISSIYFLRNLTMRSWMPNGRWVIRAERIQNYLAAVWPSPSQKKQEHQ